MTRLSPTDYLLSIRRESTRFRDVLAGCDPAARVPACPDWDAADLLWHLAEVQWFWAHVVRQRPAAPADDLTGPPRPADHPALLAAFDEYSAALATALDAADPAETAWSWAPEQTVGFTLRRQAHEALIHRLDAEQAAGEVTPLDPALAADGVAELVEVMYGGQAPGWASIEPADHHVRIDLTDTGHALWVQPCTLRGTDPGSGRNHDGPHLLAVPDPGTAPAAVVAGAAGDVDAWLWKRRDDAAVAVSGDQGALAAFLAAVHPPLD